MLLPAGTCTCCAVPALEQHLKSPPAPPEPVKTFRWWPVQLFLALLLAVDLYLVTSRRSLATENPVDALDADVLAEVEVDSSPAEEF